MNRLLGKDFLSGMMFIAFGVGALWFGRNLALGTTVRMGPGYVPHMLANIMMLLGSAIQMLMNNNQVKIRLEGSVRVKRGGMGFNVPVRYEGEERLEVSF